MPANSKIGFPATAGAAELSDLLFHTSAEVLERLLEHPALNEEHLLTLLSRKNLPRSVLSRIARNRSWASTYSIKLAILKHPHAPRDVALRLLKFVYVFDLLELVFTPGIPAELKRLAEDAIIGQRESLAVGQRISLARRGSCRLAGLLLADREPPVVKAALSNPYLTEQAVAAGLLLDGASSELAFLVQRHPRWSVSRLVKQALVRSGHVSLSCVMGILPELTASELADVAADQRVARNVRAYAARLASARVKRKGGI